MFELPRGAKAGAFAYAGGQRLEPSLTRGGQRLEPSLTRGGKGWSLRLRGRQRLEPSLTWGAKAGAFAYAGAKAGAFAYAGAKGWSLRLRGGQRLEPSLTREAKAGAFAYAGGKGWSLRLRRGRQRLEPSLALDQLPDLLGDGQTQFLMSVGRQMDAIGTVGRDDLRRVEDRDVCRS
jgi:hypothetical protein